jgi:pilus assembly protein CpaC
MMKPAQNSKRSTAAFAAFLLATWVALVFGRALAEQIVTLTLTAGEAYVIKNVDPGSSPAVSFTDNSNSFTVKSSGPNSLTVFTFQKGEGTIDTKVAGQDVTYHVIVGGVINVEHPLRPGVAPPALSGAGHAEIPQPVPYAPAGAAVASAPPSASAAAPASAGPSGASPDSGTGPMVAGAASAPGEYDEGGGTTRTEVVGPTAFSGATDGGAEYAAGAEGSNPPPTNPAAGSPPPAQNPNIGRSYGGEWHEQPPSVVSQQFSTNPRRFRPEEYVNNPAFGGRHNLPPEAINITSGTSQVFDFGGPISRVSIANTRVADVQVLGNHQLMLVGHQPGFSSLVVWDAQGNYVERQIWTEIAGHQQVMLHVIVAEVDLNKIQQQGADIAVALKNIGLTLVSLPGGVATPYTSQSGSVGPIVPPLGGTPLPLLFNQNMTYLVAGNNSNVAAWSFFQFLESHDLARILARPQLLANSGQKAKFLSGGEIPIVITQALTTTIVFKQYGTSVVFIPTVIGGRDIDMLVRPEVSKPDYSQGVMQFGFNIPAFVTRRAETRVRLRDNQTLIIAGLILDDSRSTIRKVPYMGDIPYLGVFFRQTYWSHDKTELVMSVTPEIVRPLPPGGEVALPTERQGPLTPEEVRTAPLSRPDVTRPRF